MNSKASANMWWIIIGAVIALVVMIILLVMFTGRTGGLEKGLSSCEGKGGICAPENGCPANTFSSSAFTCPGSDTQECCVGAPKDCTTSDGVCADGEECTIFGSKKYCK